MCIRDRHSLIPHTRDKSGKLIKGKNVNREQYLGDKEIKFINILGKGGYGRIHGGTYGGRPCAIKESHESMNSRKNIQDYYGEIIKQNELLLNKKFNEMRLNITNQMAQSLNLILSKYADENDISLVIQKKFIVIARSGLDITSEMNPNKDPLYENIQDTELPLSECLKDTYERVIPYWEEFIKPNLKYGDTLIAAHGNSLRALCKQLFNIFMYSNDSSRSAL